MQFFKSRKIVTVFLAVIIVSAISSVIFLKSNKEVGIVMASLTDNVRGFAWSELYGWISFNSADCDVNNNNYIDASTTVGALTDCGGNDNSTTPIKAYGTKIDVATGVMTGYAWNPLLGYICIGSTCQAITSPPASWTPSTSSTITPLTAMTATYNRTTSKLSGWANILSLKDDGWIRFDNTATSSNGVFIDAGTGIATGWAWNGYDNNSDGQADIGAGWISFNCNDTGAGGCATSTYAVIANVNRPPNVSGVGVDYTGVNDPCLAGNSVKNVALKWIFTDDDAQSGYVINITSPISATYNASTTNYSGIMTGLAYGTLYTYTLTVYDSGNPALSTTTPTLSFTTKPNEYPDVSFTWYAPNASAEEEIMFAGVSKYYTPTSPSTPTTCTSAACSWKWTTTDVADVISASTASSTMITFAQKGTSDIVTFTATSTADNLSCSTSTTMNVSEKLPDWAERGN